MKQSQLMKPRNLRDHEVLFTLFFTLPVLILFRRPSSTFSATNFDPLRLSLQSAKNVEKSIWKFDRSVASIVAIVGSIKAD